MTGHTVKKIIRVNFSVQAELKQFVPPLCSISDIILFRALKNWKEELKSVDGSSAALPDDIQVFPRYVLAMLPKEISSQRVHQ